MYLLGVIVGLVVFIRASDIYGRKSFLFATSHINTICYFMIIFMIRDLQSTYILMFLMGLSASVRNNIGYVYGIELIPVKWQETVGTIERIFELIPSIMSPLYFYYFSKNWIYY